MEQAYVDNYPIRYNILECPIRIIDWFSRFEYNNDREIGLTLLSYNIFSEHVKLSVFFKADLLLIVNSEVEIYIPPYTRFNATLNL